MIALRIAMTALVAAATLALFAPAARAIEAAASTPLNVRSGPGMNYHVVDVLDVGERVEVGECTAGGWCHITHRGPDGWVLSSYLTIPSDRAEAQPGRDCRLMLTFDRGRPSLQIICDGGGGGFPFPPGFEADRACFYAGSNYTGQHFCTGTGTIDALDTTFNNRISSVRLSGNARARLCQDRNLGGFCRTVVDDEAALGPFLNNRVSSLSVFTGGGPGPRPWRPAIYSSGSIILSPTGTANLDTGGRGGSGGDIWYRNVNPFLRFIAPRNGARLALGDGSNRGYAGCRSERFSSAQIALSELPVGTYVCVRTDEGRISQFRVNGLTGSTLRISYTTWAN